MKVAIVPDTLLVFLIDATTASLRLDRELIPTPPVRVVSAGTYGNMGPRNVRGPRSIRIDMGLTRAFQVRERQTLEFRAEAFNVPNLVNLGNPTLVLTSSTFGQILSASDPRIMQLALKFVF